MTIVLVLAQALDVKGGPSTYARNLAARLRAHGQHVTILTAAPGAGSIAYREGRLAGGWDLFRLFVRLRPDVIHVHGRLQAVAPAWWYRRCVRRATRVVFTFHTAPWIMDFLPLEPRGQPDYSPLMRRVARGLLRRCDAITSVSRNIVEDLNAHYGLAIARYTVVPSAAGVDSVAPARLADFRRRHGLEPARPVLATIGVMSWDWKVLGQQYCLEALARLRSRYPAVTLLVAGDGRHRAYLEARAAEWGVAERVVFLGNVEAVHEVLAAADIYVHLALNEGCPLSVIEAMAAGKPIVAARRGGIPEIVRSGETGLLIEPSAAELATEVERLWEDEPLRRRLAEAARREAGDQFNWERITDRYLAVYGASGSDRGARGAE